MSGLKVAEVFRRQGEAYRQIRAGRLGRVERCVRGAIEACRTAALGGHVERCGGCGLLWIAYNSRRNRLPEVPGRGGGAARRAAGRAAAGALLPRRVHAAGTGGEIVFQNKAVVYAIPFRAVAEALRPNAADPKHLGATIGLAAVLHSYLGQNLHHLPHLHCIVPDGGLLHDESRWVACRPGFFLPVRELSRLLRWIFLGQLLAAFEPASSAPSAALPACPSRRRLRVESPSFPASCGWCTPSRRSPARNRCWPISAATPTASPSRTAG